MLPILDNEGRIIQEIEAIIDYRDKRLHSRVIKVYLIKWKNIHEEDTWDSKHFHMFHPL